MSAVWMILAGLWASTTFTGMPAAPFWGETAWNQGSGGVFLETPLEGLFLANPALLGGRENWHWRLIDGGVGLSALSAYQSFYGRQWTNNPNDYQDLLGRSYWAQGQGWFALSFWEWGFFFHRCVDLWFRVDEPMNPSLRGRFLEGATYGLARGWLINSQLALGLAVKRIDFMGGPFSIPVTGVLGSSGGAVLDQIRQLYMGGTGYGVDVGFSWDVWADAPQKLVVSGAWHRVGYVGLGYPDHWQAPMRVLPDDAYLQVHGIAPWSVGELSWGLQWRGPHHPGPIASKWHAGLQWRLAPLQLQAGLYQGYSSVGVGLDLYLFKLQVAFFRVEQGYYAGQWPQDRLSINLELQWFRDTWWNNRDSEGNRRPIWQRR